MKIKKIVCILFLVLLTGCFVTNETKKMFTYCYNDTYTGLDTLININGYYSMPKISKTYNGNLFEDTIHCMFYENGFFIKDFWPEENRGLYGRYIICYDTIKAQYLYPPQSVNAGINEVWYKILDKNKIIWLYTKSWAKITNEDIKKFQQSDFRFRIDTAHFVQCTNLPNPDRFWIKWQKFFWCDELKYNDFMEKVKREKIKKYNDFKKK